MHLKESRSGWNQPFIWISYEYNQCMWMKMEDLSAQELEKGADNGYIIEGARTLVATNLCLDTYNTVVSVQT